MNTVAPDPKLNWRCIVEIMIRKQEVRFTVPPREWREQIRKRMNGGFSYAEFRDAWDWLKSKELMS